MVDHLTFTEAEIENKVALVMAGHKMAGFHVTEPDREVARAIISGELDANLKIAAAHNIEHAPAATNTRPACATESRTRAISL